MVRRVGYPPDQKLNIRFPSETRIKKITLTVSVHIYTHGRADGLTGRPVLSGGSSFTDFFPPLPPASTNDFFLALESVIHYFLSYSPLFFLFFIKK
jgi:hypothetical protein